VDSTAAPWSVAGNRTNHFDILRLVLAVLVVLSHCYDVTATGAAEPLSAFTRNQLPFGAFAVHGFFLISGFLITASWEQGKGLADYLRKRVLRIHPGFLIACLVSALVIAPLASGDPLGYLKQIDIPKFVGRALMLRTMELPDAFPGNPHHGVNVPLWTIAYEFICYLMVAALGLIGLLRRRGAVGLMFVGSLALMATWPADRPGALADLVRLTTYFLGGMCFHLFRDRIPWSRTWSIVAGAILVGTLALGKGLMVAQATCGAYLLFQLAFLPVRPLPIARQGDLSYGIYLYGWPVQQWVVHSMGPATSPLAVFATTLLPVAALAMMSWRFVERPFLRRAPRPAA